MNLLMICLLAVASMSLLPSQVDGGAPSTDVKAPAAAASIGEIWQEDDREVLIRNVRGAKNKDAQTGSASGKKGSGKNGRKNGGGGGHKRGKDPSTAHHRQQNHKNPKQSTPPLDDTNRCRYTKSQWSECDAKTNQRTRTLTLKRQEAGCVQTRTIQKKCKKACRYEKGAWSECVAGKMNRVDKLRANNAEVTGAAAPICEPNRNVQKNCNAGKKAERKQKDKGGRKGRA